MRLRLAYTLVVSAAVVACSDDPVSYSAPVGINLKAKSADTENSVVSDEKNINTESGNPYAAFVSDARAELGGRDPSVIDVDEVDLFLGAGSTGVTRLGEIFDASVEVVFQMNDTNNSYSVATRAIEAAAGAGPIGFEVVFDARAIPDVDHAKLLSGSFKVTVRGPAAAGFESKGADADLQVTLTFAAFE